MSNQKKPPSTTYEPTTVEQKAIASLHARREQAKPLSRQSVRYDEAGVPSLEDGHTDPAVGATITMEALGLTRVPEFTALLQQIVNLTQKNQKADEDGINEMLCQIAAIEPSDGIEAMLAAQMVAIHNASLKTARLLRGADMIPQQDSSGNLLNKLSRTFAMQVDTLKRYRTGGQQKVTVEHVTVNEGGQAVVGNVDTRGGGRT